MLLAADVRWALVAVVRVECGLIAPVISYTFSANIEPLAALLGQEGGCESDEAEDPKGAQEGPQREGDMAKHQPRGGPGRAGQPQERCGGGVGVALEPRTVTAFPWGGRTGRCCRGPRFWIVCSCQISWGRTRWRAGSVFDVKCLRC